MEKSFPTIQSFPWAASVNSVKSSENFGDYSAFYKDLIANLPINSSETRIKYANVIQRRFFPDRSFNGTAPMVWRAYHDEKILVDVMRAIALESEVAVGDFLLTRLQSIPPGSVLDQQVAREFIVSTYGEFKKDSYTRLHGSLRDMGFLAKHGQDWIVQKFETPTNAFLILLHERLAPVPRIVRLNEILDTQWWRYLGLRDASEVREILHQAAAAGLIARFSKVDELEQATTTYTRGEYFEKALRL
jgi:hypothetical protein